MTGVWFLNHTVVAMIWNPNFKMSSFIRSSHNYPKI